MKGKKGVAISQVLFGALAVLLIFVMALGYNIYRREGIKGINQISNLFGDASFVPYKPIYTDEEQIVLNSMKALIDSINSLAKREYLNSYGNERINEYPGFSKYRITWSGDIEFEEADCLCGVPFVLECEGPLCNSHRRWSFSKEFDVIIGNPTQQEDWIWADYYYGECSNPGSDQWTDKGYCNQIDDSVTDYRNGRIRDDIVSDLAAVRDIMPVYNIKLETLDSSGNVLCTATTADSNNIRGLVDTSKDEFITWGAVGDWKETCGSDNDGDGIKGQYCEDDYGKPWREIVPEERHQDVLNSGKVQRYFPEGVIKDSMDNGENCLDSPTWLECNGIRIYYCGKTGYKSGANDERDYYYFGSDDDLHSRSGTKYLRVIDPEKFTRQGPSSEFRNTMGDITDDRNQIQVRDPDWNNPLQWGKGAWDYARDYDLDIVLGVGLGTIVWPWGGIVAGGVALATKEAEDPRVFCYGGKNYSGSNVVAKCDPELGACGVCDFELPDKPAKTYDENVLIMAGYGDPKYVIYYEAFPPGEEEAWRMDPLDLGLGSIILWNSAGLLFDAVRFTKIGGKLTVAGKKVLGFMEKIPVLKQAINLIKAGGKVISWLGRNTEQGVRYLGNQIMDILKLSTKGAGHADIAVKAFGDAGNILKYVSPEELADVGVNLERAINYIETGVHSSDEVLDGILYKLGPDAVTTLDVAKQQLPQRFLQKGARYIPAYLVGYSLAKLDSQNQKFYPIGVNSIGLKKPYQLSLVSGDSKLPALNDKVSEYYIQLVKDKKRGGAITNLLLDQSAQRFFLASPCKANLQIVESMCPCWDIDEEDVSIHEFSPGNPVHVLDMTVDDTKTNPKEKYKNAIKVCRDRTSGFTSLTLEQPVLQTQCILVNPVLQGDTFCYSGTHTLEEIAQVGVITTQLTASIGNEILWDAIAAGTAPSVVGPVAAIALKAGINIGIDVVTTIAYNALEKETKWPNH